MPRRCTICDHSDRSEIEAALLGAEPFRKIAERSGTSIAALVRHKDSHIPSRLIKAHDVAEVSRADTLLEQVEQLQAKALVLLEKAEQSDDFRTALQGVREARSCLELKAKLEGQLKEGTVVNVLISSEWIQVRSLIVAILAPFPEARTAVADALGRHHETLSS